MTKYRKKPVVIEAVQFVGDSGHPERIADWCGGYMGHLSGRVVLVIPTLAGDRYAQYGDWILQGVLGQFYLCKPDIFEATYDEVF